MSTARRTMIGAAMFFLAAAGALSLVTMARASAPTIENAGFEDHLLGWTRSGSAAITHRSLRGGHSLRVTGGDGWARQEVPVAPDTDYILSALVRGRGSLGAVVDGTERWSFGSRGATERVTVEFNSGKATTVEIYAAHGGGIARFDEFGLTSGATTGPPTSTTTTVVPTTTGRTTVTAPPTSNEPITTATPSTNTPTTTTETASPTTPTDSPRLPPTGAGFDYQIGGPYGLPGDASVVSRDWTADPAVGGYNICYINAFQTQGNYGGSRPDESQNWPGSVVLLSSEDPNWPGEYLIDISTQANRLTAADHLQQIINTCKAKGYDAVEFDNLDSWTRLDGLPFGIDDTVAYAKLLTGRAHDAELAVAQKNTTQLISTGLHRDIGFDFAIAEQCGQYRECEVFIDGYGSRVFAIEYDDAGFDRACSRHGDAITVIRRDVGVVRPGDSGYVRQACR